jgi:aspartyl-tRNA(Asn)/glutamyl-tRNA(Gln) amidotransferase subunit C
MIQKKDVQHIARLARIDLEEKEVDKFQKDLSSILDYFELLKEAKTDKVEPTFYSSQAEHSAARKDEARPDDVADELIKQSPAKKDRYIKVRAILK